MIEKKEEGREEEEEKEGMKEEKGENEPSPRTGHDGPESRPRIKLYMHIFDNYRGTM
jgi:hypothetical protein